MKKLIILMALVIIVLSAIILFPKISGLLNKTNTSNAVEINMKVDYSGYTPNSFVLKKGVPVIWKINVEQLSGCNNQILLPELNINKKLKQGINIIEFTPEKEGNLEFTCGMNMLKGNFMVTEDGTATTEQIIESKPTSSGSCGMGSGSCGCGKRN